MSRAHVSMASPKLLSFDLWSDLHCRLYWGYRGRPAPSYHNCTYSAWPSGAWLILKGSVKMTGAGKTESAEAGQWIFPGNEPRKQHFSADAEILSLRYIIAWRSGMKLFEHADAIILEREAFPMLESSALELVECMEEKLGGPGPGGQLGLSRESVETHFSVMHRFYHWSHQYVHTMMSHHVLPSTPSETDPRVDTAMAWLNERPLSEPWTETELARGCGLSVSQLNRLFVRSHGMTPVAMYERRKLEAAILALEMTDDDIKAIAYDLGFSSPGHFTTWFKRKSGKTPSARRREALRHGS